MNWRDTIINRGNCGSCDEDGCCLGCGHRPPTPEQPPCPYTPKTKEKNDAADSR